MRQLSFIALGVGALLILAWWRPGTTPPPGVLVDEEPVQESFEAPPPSFEKNGYRITPLARFHVHARVLSTERYWLGRTADLSPVDLAMGWGRMSDTAVIEPLHIRQGGRFYWYRWSGSPPIPSDEIVRSSANMHIIPADAFVEHTLRAIRSGEVVTVDGELVRVDASDGWHWVSSLTREDSGDGACELIWATSIERR